MNTKIYLTIILTMLLAVAMPDMANGAGRPAKKERTVFLGGEVYDSFTRTRVKAVVTLLNADSATVDTDTCDLWRTFASFGFTVPRRPARYVLKVEAEGYETAFVPYDMQPRGRKAEYLVPTIHIKRAPNDIYRNVGLDEVVVSGTRVQIAYRGDTIVYDASAFNLPDGSMLDALIRQMPGVELKDNGTIYVNGKKVDYLLLNGKEFFRGKNKVMLENLPYFTVKEIKVYDKSTERSEMLGRDIEPKDFVMDVNLKREYARSYIANAEAGAGTDNRWAARAFGLYFDDRRRVAVFGNANNVNEDRRPGSRGDWSPAKMERGLLATKQAGLSLQTETREKRVMNDLDATVTWSDADNERHNATETLAAAGNIFGGSSSFSRAKDFNTSVSDFLRLRKLHIQSRNALHYTNSRNTAWGSDSTMRDTLLNRSWSDGLGRSRLLSLNGITMWSQPLPWGDILSIDAQYMWQKRTPDELFGLSGTQYAASLPADRRNYYTDAADERYSYSIELGYMFALPKGWYVEPNFTYGQDWHSASTSRYRLDRLGEGWTDATGLLPSTRDSLLMAFDWDNSDWGNSLTRSYSGEVSIQKSTDNMEFFLSLPVKHSRERLHYNDYSVDTVATRSYTEFSPWLEYRYNKGRQRHELSYQMRVAQPEFTALMPGDDTTNPLAHIVSNPDLKARTDHRLSWQTTLRCDSARLTWYVGADATFTHGAWGVRTTYDTQTGAYTYTDDNVDGNWQTAVKLGVNGALDSKRRLRYAVGAATEYVHSVDFAVAYDTPSDDLSRVNTVRTGLDMSLTYTLGKLTAGLAGKYASHHSRSDRAGFKPIDAFDYQYGASLTYTIPVVDIDLSTDFNVFSRRGYGSAEMNTDDPVWNAQLSKSFFKGCLVAKLTAFDLLHQLSNKDYSVNAQGRTETRYNSIPRYLMLSLAYKFARKAKH